MYQPHPYLFGAPLDVIEYATFDCAFAAPLSAAATLAVRVEDVNDPPQILNVTTFEIDGKNATGIRIVETEGTKILINLNASFADKDAADETHVLINVLPTRGRLYERNASSNMETEMYHRPLLPLSNSPFHIS